MDKTKRLKNLRLARREIVRKEWEKEDGKVEVMLDLMDKIEDLPNELNRKVIVNTTVESKDVVAELKEVYKILADLRIPEPLSEVSIKNLDEIKMPEFKYPGSMTISNLKDFKIPAPIVRVVSDTNSIVVAIEKANSASLARFDRFATSLYKKEKPVYVKILGRDDRIIDVFGGTAGGGQQGGWQLDTLKINDDDFPLKTVILTSTGGFATFGGGTQYQDNTTTTGGDPTGTMGMYWDTVAEKVRAVSDVNPMPVRPQSSSGNVITSTGITIGTSSVEILAANTDRINYVIVNASTGDIFLKRSSTGQDAIVNRGILIVKRGGSVSDDIHKGVITGIAGTTGLIVTVEEI